MHILVVEDDELLGDGLCAGLCQDGHKVSWIRDGASAKKKLSEQEFDLLVLDLGLPKLSGINVLQHLRSNENDIPVLILTARDSVEDRVRGLDYGADDYVTKPFDLDELTARVRALQRRLSPHTDATIVYNHINLDPLSHKVTVDGQEVNISRREFALLQKMLENVGRVMSREYLTQYLYGWTDDVDSNALEVHIHNVRKKVGANIIRTIRGVGYMVEKEK